ncbi:hypothetical protein BZA77DRAFT_316523 [Pyronema omphalodes]|nr:hypothetical protein BZA77DRAFT_316523 [Pyronema omphalodes]
MEKFYRIHRLPVCNPFFSFFFSSLDSISFHFFSAFFFPLVSMYVQSNLFISVLIIRITSS